MHAERIILETDTQGNIKNAPKLPPNRHVEAIFLVLDESETPAPPKPRRRPHQDIAGRLRILGDVMSSAPGNEWNLPG
jgi:hypothetical protein